MTEDQAANLLISWRWGRAWNELRWLLMARFYRWGFQTGGYCFEFCRDLSMRALCFGNSFSKETADWTLALHVVVNPGILELFEKGNTYWGPCGVIIKLDPGWSQRAWYNPAKWFWRLRRKK